MVTKTTESTHNLQLFWQRKACHLLKAVSMIYQSIVRVPLKTEALFSVKHKEVSINAYTFEMLFSTALTISRMSFKKNCKLVPTMCFSKTGRIHSFSSHIE
jgi:hypothetical protein